LRRTGDTRGDSAPEIHSAVGDDAGIVRLACSQRLLAGESVAEVALAAGSSRWDGHPHGGRAGSRRRAPAGAAVVPDGNRGGPGWQPSMQAWCGRSCLQRPRPNTRPDPLRRLAGTSGQLPSDLRIRLRCRPGIGMGQKRDLTGIETRKGRKGTETYRAYVSDPGWPGRKITGPWGTYDEAREWRRRALAVKAETKQRARQRRAEDALASLERSLLQRRGAK
jgi:hypothetical protein